MADVLTHIDTLDVEVAAQEPQDIEAEVSEQTEVNVGGEVSVAVWGGIFGNIEQQTDLTDYIKKQVEENQQENIPTIPIEYIEALR